MATGKVRFRISCSRHRSRSFLFHQTQVAMMFVFLLPVLLVVRCSFDLSRFAVLVAPAMIPFVWFEALSNHTQIHTWFTYRPVASSIGIVISAALIASGYSTINDN